MSEKDPTLLTCGMCGEKSLRIHNFVDCIAALKRAIAAAEERGRRAEHERAQSVIHVLHQCIRGKCDCGPGQFACEETARTVIDSWDLAPRDSGPVIASSGSVFEDDE